MNLEQTPMKRKPLDDLTKAMGLLDEALEDASEAALYAIDEQPGDAAGLRQDLLSAREWVNGALMKLARCHIARATTATATSTTDADLPDQPGTTAPITLGITPPPTQDNDCDGEADTPLVKKLKRVIGTTSRLDLKAAELAYLHTGPVDNDSGKLHLVGLSLWLVGPFATPKLITHAGTLVAEGLGDVCREIARRMEGGAP